MLVDSLVVLIIECIFIFIFNLIKKKNRNNIKKLIFYRHFFKSLVFLLLAVWIVVAFWYSSEDMMKITMLAIMGFSVPFFSFFRRLTAPIYSEKVIDKLENFGLYLRSFKDDEKFGGGGNEANIIKIFNKIFPVYAVGKPVELISPEGAKRIYIEENNWRKQVARLSSKAKFILLKISNTENFLWECKYCIETVGLDKLIFFGVDNEKSKVIYNSFVSFLKTTFSIKIPDCEFVGCENFFIYFKGNKAIRMDYKEKRYIENIAIQFLRDHSKLNEKDNLKFNEEDELILNKGDELILNEEDEIFLKKRKKSFLRLFSLRKDKDITRNIQKWNWGAFMFSWIYGLSNRTTDACWLFTFFIDAISSIILMDTLLFDGQIYHLLLPFLMLHCFWGMNGNKVAWLSKRWTDEEYFRKIQNKWNIAGILTLFAIAISISIRILMIM
jgi:hypothetical protein